MKNLLFFAAIAMAPFFFSAKNAPITNATLADEVVGLYTGTFANEPEVTNHFQIRVSKVDNITVKIEAVYGNQLTPFKAMLADESLSAMRVIKLSVGEGLVLKEGLMTPVNGRLTYALLTEDGVLEVFSGVKK